MEDELNTDPYHQKREGSLIIDIVPVPLNFENLYTDI